MAQALIHLGGTTGQASTASRWRRPALRRRQTGPASACFARVTKSPRRKNKSRSCNHSPLRRAASLRAPGPSIDIVVRQSGTWAPTKSRRAGLSAANPELVAYSADLTVHELDREHVLGRPDNPERGVGMGVKDFGTVAAVFAGPDIAVIACCIKGQPVRSATAFQCQSLFENRGHRIIHCPDINMRIIPAAALPHLFLIGGPTNPVQQPRVPGWVIGEARGNDLAGLEIDDLHSPKVHHVVHDVVARTVHGVRAKDSRIRADA